MRTQPLGAPALAAIALALAAAFSGFVALGVWQLHRLQWKQALIAQVEQHLSSAPIAAPPPAEWPSLGAADRYRRLRVQGVYDHARETCTQAVTERGPGCWMLTPLHTPEGWWVLVNRGFVSPERRLPAARAAGQVTGVVTVEGLLRQSEPGGGFLRHNDLASDRWYSRDVAAIARARGLPADATAPYFIDASNTDPGGPIGGLTVVQFRNQHLQYALTWLALAAMTFAAGARLLQQELRQRLRGDNRS